MLLIVNPTSRRASSAEASALREFHAAGVTCDVQRTARAGHAVALARQCIAGERPDAVFTLGGDGTAMDVVGALSGLDLPVGILPGGTANQLARFLKTPLGIPAAVRALLGGSVARLDLGRLANGRRFALTTGFGMDAAMIAKASVRAKRLLGVAAYVWSGTRALLANARIQVRASVDGRIYERECAVAMIVNVGSFFAGRLQAGPGVRADDGLLDLCLYSARTPIEGAAVLRRCFAGDFRPQPNMLFARGVSIHLETFPPSPAEADGELLAPGSLHATVEPLAAQLLQVPLRDRN